jgi:hypothetical protein
MFDELESIWKAASVTYSGIIPEGTTEKHEKPQSIACVSAEVRTEYLRNVSLQRYQYTTLPGVYMYIRM